MLLVTDTRSLQASVYWDQLLAGLDRSGIGWEHLIVSGEPSPQLVDGAVSRWHGTGSRGSSMKTNPIVLTDGELTNILSQRLL